MSKKKDFLEYVEAVNEAKELAQKIEAAEVNVRNLGKILDEVNSDIAKYEKLEFNKVCDLLAERYNIYAKAEAEARIKKAKLELEKAKLDIQIAEFELEDLEDED